MRVFAIDHYKGALTEREIPDPLPQPGEVIVEIKTASVNPLDEKLRLGMFKAVLPQRMPLVLGHDLSGVVVATGPGAATFKPGDEVFACKGNEGAGTFAERIAIAESLLALKPARLDHAHAAALPLVSLTAWQVLVERANIRRGHRVLIHAGSGGVGTVAIQLAKHLGAFVATTVGPDNVSLAKDLGADVIIDYRKDDFEKQLSGYDLVLNTLGPEVLGKSLSVLKRGGKLISISGPPDAAFARQIGAGWLVRQILWLGSIGVRRKAKARGVEYSFLFLRPNGDQLRQIAKLADEGAIRPILDRIVPFPSTPAALLRVASGRARGKVVIQIAEDSATDRPGRAA